MPSLNAQSIQVRDAVPLLVNFINTTDRYIQTGKVAANLRFAHAETISPFAALIGIVGASRSTVDILQFDKVWQAENVIPLSSNIQWILFKDNHNSYLVKFLLNEKEIGIHELKTTHFPYYRWQDVRNYYIKKLNGLSVQLTDDMHSYLLKLK